MNNTRRNNTRPFFLWKLHFAEAFQEKGGFDVVIANPPYVRHEGIKIHQTPMAKAFGNSTAAQPISTPISINAALICLKTGRPPLLHLLPINSCGPVTERTCAIFLTTQVTPKLIIDFGDLPIFDATTYPSILLVEKRPACWK